MLHTERLDCQGQHTPPRHPELGHESSASVRVRMFFFQAEDGIRYLTVTGVQTCALPISTGRGECVPYARYGETAEGVAGAIEAMRGDLTRGLDRIALQTAMPAGAARNALDCAVWGLAAKRAGGPGHALAGPPPPRPLGTAYTISFGTPAAMAAPAPPAAARPPPQ